MSDEPNCSPGERGKPFHSREVSYHDHFDEQIHALKEFVVQGFELRDTAGVDERALRDRVALSDAIALNERLARLNELREVVSLIQAGTATKAELALARDNVETLARAIAAELRGEMVTAHNFRIAHDETAKKLEVADQLTKLWERIDERSRPLDKAITVIETKASQAQANIGIGLAFISVILTVIHFVIDHWSATVIK